MPYCTNTQVAAAFRNLVLSSTTKVTDTEVDEWILEADAEIDGRIGTRYIVPLTGAESLKIVRTISISLVADRVRVALPNNDLPSSNADKKAFRPAVLSRPEAEKKLQMIQKGELLLSDATLISSKDGVGGFGTDNNYETFFKRPACSDTPEPDQW